MPYMTESVWMHRARCKECGAVFMSPSEDHVHEWMREHDDEHGRQW